MNHRIFERTLRPLVFRGACLSERHYTPQAWLGIGRRGPRPRALKSLRLDRLSLKRRANLAVGFDGLAVKSLSKVDLGSGRDTR